MTTARPAWTRRALLRLTRTEAVIRRDNPAAAAAVMARIGDCAGMLAVNPRIGRPGRIVGTRAFIVLPYPYILSYREIDNGVQILTVLHAAQKWPERLD